MTQKIRGFELVKGETNLDLLPKRSTQHSAGYDFVAAETITIDPGAIKLVPTNVKAYMQEGEVLYLYDRSSNPRKRGIVLSNSVGVIDKDYYGNPDNDGNIHAQFTNITNDVVTIEKGTAMMQGVFMPFLLADDDDASGVRVGGFGSTDQ
ncbi:MAG: dUTP diphosphatase [Streptococcus sp.]|jgi:dUTP diphosphatase|nr:MAG: dUTP diphosphatase [Streptococcus sp.]